MRFLLASLLAVLFCGSAAASDRVVEFCVGEQQGRCPASATWVRCGPDVDPKPTVESAARDICGPGRYKRFEFVRQFGGNYCGYNIARAICESAQSGASTRAAPAEFVVASAKIDQTMQAKSAFDIAADCGNNVACSAIISAISAYTGVPLDKVTTAAATVKKFSARDSETADFRLTLPAGYRYCTSTMKTVSIVPFDGARGSLFSGRAAADGMTFQTWTPKMSDGSRAWVEATVSVVGVRQDIADQAYASRKCLHPGTGDGRLLFHCRGGGCQSATDKGQSVSASDPGPRGNAR